MKVKTILLTAILCCINGIASAQCYYKVTDTCISLKSVFGYDEQSCPDCDPNQGGGWDCPGGTAYHYLENNADYYRSPMGQEMGNDDIDIQQGDGCVQYRPCEDCSADVGPEDPFCLFKDGTVWTTFVWGSDITYVGMPCP